MMVFKDYFVLIIIPLLLISIEFTDAVTCPYLANSSLVVLRANCPDKCCDNPRPTSVAEACCEEDMTRTIAIILGYTIPMVILLIGLISCCCYCYCALKQPPIASTHHGVRRRTRMSRLTSIFGQNQITPGTEIKEDTPPTYDELGITEVNTNEGSTNEDNKPTEPTTTAATDAERVPSAPPTYNAFVRNSSITNSTRNAW